MLKSSGVNSASVSLTSRTRDRACPRIWGTNPVALPMIAASSASFDPSANAARTAGFWPSLWRVGLGLRVSVSVEESLRLRRHHRLVSHAVDESDKVHRDTRSSPSVYVTTTPARSAYTLTSARPIVDLGAHHHYVLAVLDRLETHLGAELDVAGRLDHDVDLVGGGTS